MNETDSPIPRFPNGKRAVCVQSGCSTKAVPRLRQRLKRKKKFSFSLGEQMDLLSAPFKSNPHPQQDPCRDWRGLHKNADGAHSFGLGRGRQSGGLLGKRSYSNSPHSTGDGPRHQPFPPRNDFGSLPRGGGGRDEHGNRLL